VAQNSEWEGLEAGPAECRQESALSMLYRVQILKIAAISQNLPLLQI
jgi:hypothetical protein